MKNTFKLILRIVIFLSIGLFLLFLIYRNEQSKFLEDCALKGIPEADCSLMNKVFTDLGNADFIWIFGIVFVFMLSNFFRSFKWRMLFEPLGFKPSFGNVFWTILLGYFANLALPRLGEVVRGTTFSKYEGIPLSKVLGTIFVDRLTDVFCLGIVAVIAFVFEYDLLINYLSEYADPSLLIKLAVVGMIGFVLFILLYRYLSKHPRYSENPIVKKITGIVSGFADGIKTVLNLKNTPLFILWTLLIWVMYYLMTVFAFQGFEITHGFGWVTMLVIFFMGSLGMVVPTPGGMGSYHFLVMAGLALYGIGSDDAFSFANIFFFTMVLFCSVLFGILSLIILPLINKNKETAQLKL